MLRPASEQPEADDANIVLSSYADCLRDKRLQAANFRHIEQQKQPQGRRSYPMAADITQSDRQKSIPCIPLWSTGEIDASFDLPYTRLPHPRYRGKVIPAYEMIRHSSEPSSRMLRRLRILYHFRPSGKIHCITFKGINTPRSAADYPYAGFQGLYQRSRRTVGQHVCHGRTRQATMREMPASVVPPSVAMRQPQHRPRSIARDLSCSR